MASEELVPAEAYIIIGRLGESEIDLLAKTLPEEIREGAQL